MRNLIVLVLGGGRGTRLFPLTQYRSKPAVPLAGKYRLIDIPLSNCVNSGMNRIYVLTQFMSVSLHRHIRQTYRFDQFGGGFVEILAAQQTMDGGTDWYEGTADAVRKQLRYIQQPGTEYVLILSGDQLYRMDYQSMLKTHVSTGADVTIAAMPVPSSAARSLGIMRCDERGRVDGFLEKPQTEPEIDLVRTAPEWFDSQGIPSQGRDCLASMGIYLFSQKTLVDVLTKTDYRDFGKEVFPAAIRSRQVQVHLFDDYWEDIGTIKAFYEANLSLVRPNPPFQLVDRTAPVYSHARFLPPSLIEGAHVSNSLIADGCRIGRGSRIENSIVGLRCILGENVTIRDSILMGADDYELDSDLAENGRLNRPAIGIGAGSEIHGAIVDKNCRLGRGVRVIASPNASSAADQCVVSDGIPVVVKDAILPDGWSLPSANG